MKNADFCSDLSAKDFSFPHTLCFPHQDILNNDETTYVLENLETDTPYVVSVTAIYPDEAESEDLLGTERTCKLHIPVFCDEHLKITST